MIASAQKAEKLLPVFELAMNAIGPLLLMDDCEDVARIADGSLWLKRTGRDFERVGQQTNEAAYNLIITAAALQGANVNHDRPVLETTLPDGNRFEAVLPPLSTSPLWTIRARSKRVYSLTSYVEHGILTDVQYERLVLALVQKENILVSGSNGSGKTSLLNGLIAHLSVIDPQTRLGLIEDTPELRSTLANHIALLAGRKGSMRLCLKTCLRMRLDRIAVGEVRGKEALVMLKAFNTGYSGMATIHASSAEAAKQRLCTLVREAIPTFDASELVRDNIHLIVQIDGPTLKHPRRVSQILEMSH